MRSEAIIRRHFGIYFLPFRGGSELKGCTARIVPNYSGFRKRNHQRESHNIARARMTCPANHFAVRRAKAILARSYEAGKHLQFQRWSPELMPVLLFEDRPALYTAL
ncbi:MAG: hypothetical protein DME75_08515 [Verrucomicrobia bacterium]|nr:MAG: hypothetical protein DME75_08515 [Verrucomicrobiota bacterium]